MAIVCFTIAISSYGQQTSIEAINTLVENEEYTIAFQKLTTLDTLKLKNYEKARMMYLTGLLYNYRNQDDESFKYLHDAKERYKRLDSVDQVDEIDFEILRLYSGNSVDKQEAKQDLEAFILRIKDKGNYKLLSKAYKQLGNAYYLSSPENPKEAFKFYKRAMEYAKLSKDDLLQAVLYQNMGACYAHIDVGKPDSALYVYTFAEKVFNKLHKMNKLAILHLNRGVAYEKKQQYQAALNEYKLADTFQLKEYKRKVKSLIQRYKGRTYKAMGDYKSGLEAYEYYQKTIDSLNEQDQKKAIEDYQTKYKTKEKELENQKLTSKNKIKNIIIYSVSGVFILLLCIGLLLLNQLSKKRKIAEQERTIETQKMQTLLREQELHEIDVMLESQEKERQRIANDLHDNLGSLLSALKLNFHTLGKRELEDNTSRKLFEKTEELINETYVQVRNISHLKNLGVVSSEGLLLAVKKMAEKMSVINRLKFNVIPFGLKERLDSNLEITLFRMIQELCSNIIKHSEATEVNIYMTQHHDQQLNIMIEDNGKGFEVSELKKMNTTGIGLKNIEKKVEQLGGTFTIDSAKSKGTTIIIDIPL